MTGDSGEDAIGDRARVLLDCFWDEHPREFTTDGRLDDWGVIGPGLYTVCAWWFESVVESRSRALDSGVLARVLWEHVVTFAWLAADPDKRVPLWVQNESDEREKMFDEMKTLGIDVPPETDRTVAEYKQYCRGVAGTWPRSPLERARVADKYWGRLLPEAFTHKGKYSFCGQYALLYRGYSAWLHPRIFLLHDFGQKLSDGRVRIGRPSPRASQSTGLSIGLFALALLVGADRLRWPSVPRLGRCLAEVFPPDSEGDPTPEG